MNTVKPIVEKSAKERLCGQIARVAAGPVSLHERLSVVLRQSPNQRVLVKHISGPHWRANWFVPAESQTGTNAVGQWKIQQSQFLHVTEDGKKLVIVDQTKRENLRF